MMLVMTPLIWFSRANFITEPQKPKYSKRILLCAPSNGAVDEIVLRLMRDGLLNAEGKKYSPAIVRVVCIIILYRKHTKIPHRDLELILMFFPLHWMFWYDSISHYYCY